MNRLTGAGRMNRRVLLLCGVCVGFATSACSGTASNAACDQVADASEAVRIVRIEALGSPNGPDRAGPQIIAAKSKVRAECEHRNGIIHSGSGVEPYRQPQTLYP